MKLSAPPPPPPEPNDPSPPDPNPDAANTAETPGADAPGSPPPPADAPGSPPKPAVWPEWFAGADLLLALLAGTLAFLAASFAARNNDLWLHLGAGRMLTTGEYSLGSDPLSYTAADRPWVNHAWLFDLGAYLLYNSDPTGFTLVLVKALAVAAGFGLLMAIRRPGASRWPWAAVAAVAVVAAVPRLTLGPLTGSVVLLCATLFVLFRVPSRPGSWRTPLVIGAIFWVWANVDAWFVLGPAVLALLLLGELVRGATRTADEPPDPLGLPDAGTLARALAVGVVACMLNPHHVRVWQLPFELVGGSGIEADARLSALRSLPFSEVYWSDNGAGHQLGYNLNGLAYAALFVAGLYAAFLSGAVGRLVGRPWDIDLVPLPHAAAWFGLAALSLLSAYAVPFLAVVTVPVVASRLNLLADRVRLGDRADRGTQFVLTGAAAGRVLTGVALAGLCLAAWPGWLYPPASNWAGPGPADPAAAHRVAWAVEPDAGLVRAASWLGEQRAAGRLPADARGLIASVELANYCAWFAPGEKVFVNGRYNHHRPELADFVAVRAAAEFRPGAEPPADPPAVGRVLAERGAGYLVLYDRGRQTSALAAYRRLGLVPAETGVLYLFGGPAQWAPWYYDGRAAAFGWRPGPDRGRPEFDRLRVDPGVLAFGPGAGPTPPDPLDPPPPPRGSLDEFFAGPAAPAPAAADEALGWMEYKGSLVRRELVVQQLGKLLLLNTPGGAPPLGAAADKAVNELAVRQNAYYPPPPADGSFLAVAVLAVKAARRAIADNPAHPDGYYALARALNDRDLPLSLSEREVGRMVALRRALDRFPPPAGFRPGPYAASPTLVAYELATVYLGQSLGQAGYSGISLDLPGVRELAADVVLARGNQVYRAPYQAAVENPVLAADAQVVDRPVLYPPDLALGAVTAALGYAPAEFGASPPAEVQNLLRGMDELRTQLEAGVGRAFDRLQIEAERRPRPRDRYAVARGQGLVNGALELLKKLRADGELVKEFEPNAPRVVLEMIALEVVAGRLDEAAADLDMYFQDLAEMAKQTPPRPGLNQYRQRAREIRYNLLWLREDYPAARQAKEELDGQELANREAVALKDLIGRRSPLAFRWPVVSVVGGPDRAAHLAFEAVLRENQVVTARTTVFVAMQEVGKYHFQLGVWALLGGDPAAAKDHFARSRRPPPAAWADVVTIPAYDPRVPRDYARYIEAAGQRAAGR